MRTKVGHYRCPGRFSVVLAVSVVSGKLGRLFLPEVRRRSCVYCITTELTHATSAIGQSSLLSPTNSHSACIEACRIDLLLHNSCRHLQNHNFMPASNFFQESMSPVILPRQVYGNTYNMPSYFYPLASTRTCVSPAAVFSFPS